MEVDGEYIGRVTDVSLIPAKRKLRVIAPENPKDGIFASRCENSGQYSTPR